MKQRAFSWTWTCATESVGLTPSSAAPERSAGNQQRSCWRELQRNVRLGRKGSFGQIHSWFVRFECLQKSGKVRVLVERPVRLGRVAIEEVRLNFIDFGGGNWVRDGVISYANRKIVQHLLNFKLQFTAEAGVENICHSAGGHWCGLTIARKTKCVARLYDYC